MTMIFHLQTIKTKRIFEIIAFFGALAFMVTPAAAQQAQQLSVSPTLIEMSAEPGQSWKSSIKVINSNPYPLQISVTVADFVPRGEGGEGRFIQLAETATDTLASWISYETGPTVIPPESAFDLPYTVNIPRDASPGGHFAAFQVGTVPQSGTPGESMLRTSQVVTSLLFLRVAGEVLERGGIREFSTSHSFYQTPHIDLSVRFENNGNVHIRPQGEIQITNMWGQKRGQIPINPQSSFGNVLPNSVRSYNVAWKSEWSLADIGRYKAVVTLAYGSDQRQFANSLTYFWVVPVVPIMSIVAVIAVLIALATWLVRLYVRRLLKLSGVTPRRFERAEIRNLRSASDLTLKSKADIPNLQSVMPEEVEWRHQLKVVKSGFKTKLYTVLKSSYANCVLLLKNPHYRYLSYAILALAVLCLMTILWWYFTTVIQTQRSYEITYKNFDRDTVVSSDEILFNEQKLAFPDLDTAPASATNDVPVIIINQSGVAGLGATAAVLVESLGFKVMQVRTDLGADLGRTRIVASSLTTDAALSLSTLLNNALVSAVDSSEASTTVTVYVGRDLAD